MNEMDPESIKMKDKADQKPPLFKKIDSEEFGELYDTRKIYLGVWRHYFLIIFCALLLAIAGFWASHKFSNTYQAEAVVLYDEYDETPDVLEGAINLTNFTMATVLDLIKTPKHLEAVKTRLGLDMEPEDIGDMIKIPTPRSDSNMIKIIARADNPNLAVDIANSLAQAAAKDSQEFTRKQLRESLENFRFQLGVVQRSLASQLGDIETFKKLNEFHEMDPRAAKILEEVEMARIERDKATLEYQSLVEQYENLKRELASLPDYVPINRESTNSPLQVRIVSLETKLAEARGRYTADNPKVLQMEEELQQLMRKSKGTDDPEEEQFFERNALKDQLSLELLHLQGKVLSAQKVMEQVVKRVAVVESKLETLPVKQMEFVKLLQVKELTEEQVRYMARAAETTQLMVNMPKGSVQLYQLAQKAQPWKEGVWVTLLPLIGLIFGFGLGLGISFFIEMMDQKIRTPRQVEMHYSVPCLAAIPELPALTRKNVEDRMLFFVRQLSEVIERIIKHAKDPVSIVNFTSSLKGEGKTTFAFLLSKYLKDTDHKTLLLELDWRKNPWDPTHGLKGIEDYLEENATFDEVLSSSPVDRVRLVKDHPRMKELVKSKRMKEFIEEARLRYPLILIDSPGVIDEDYTTNIAELSDCTLLFVGSSKVKKSKVDVSLSVLDKAGVRAAGVILNRVKKIYINDYRLKQEVKKSNRQLFSFRRKSRG